MNSTAYDTQVLVFSSDLTSNRWSPLSLTVAADNSIQGSFQYIGPAVKLTGKMIPGNSQDRYELDQDGVEAGEGINIRFSSYPTFGSQLPIAGVASIGRARPFFVLGSLLSS